MAEFVLFHNHKIKKAHNLKLDSPNSKTPTLDRRIINTNKMESDTAIGQSKIREHISTCRHCPAHFHLHEELYVQTLQKS